MHYALTLKSSNRKTGPIPVSTSTAETCPDACPLKRDPVTGAVRGCYADGGPLAIQWATVTAGSRGEDWASFVARVAALPEGTLWRHNQAGDLPGRGDTLDVEALAQLVTANAGRRGFTYTHKPLRSAGDRAAIKAANAAGFTINLSANSPAHADALADLGVGPVALVLDCEEGTRAAPATPAGRAVRVCPATYRDDVDCLRCQACANPQRSVIIGFPAHGSSKKRAVQSIKLYRQA